MVGPRSRGSGGPAEGGFDPVIFLRELLSDDVGILEGAVSPALLEVGTERGQSPSADAGH